MADFPELPPEGDTSDLGEELDVPAGDYLTEQEAEADETVDIDETE